MAKKKITILIDEELLEVIRDIVYWDPAETMGEYIEGCVEMVINGLLELPQKRPEKKLRPGRRIT